MATSDPRLEFFRFKLHYKKKDTKKTFRDFAIDELNGNESMSDNDIFELCFEHFIKEITTKHARSDKKKKTITLIADPKKNPYLSQKPTPSIQRNILSGVIDGGPFGREAIVSDMADKENSSVLGRNKSVLLPYYIFVYLPANHFEGFFMVHSYSREDSITDVFKSYVTNIFSGRNYNKPIAEIFAPKSFQEEYRNGAIIKNMTFSTTVINSTLSNDPIQDQFNEYKVEITITPLSKKGGKKISFTHVSKLIDKLNLSKYFNGDKDIEVKNFEKKKIVVENEITKQPKTFDLDLLDNDFALKHFLKDYVSETGTPDFEQLKQHCIELFNNTILRELRPDLDVTNI